jgi:hypothetical protein
MADEVGERTVKSGFRWYRRFLTWAAASPGISGRSLAVRAAIAHHVDDQAGRSRHEEDRDHLSDAALLGFTLDAEDPQQTAAELKRAAEVIRTHGMWACN